MRIFLILCLIGLSPVFGQTDYNTKKGFVAEGYDVVEYFNDMAIEVDKRIILEHDGVKYKFSSQENLERFKANPEKNIPQYGGYCAYAIAVNAKKVSIDPETFEIRDGKLYLFYNAWGTNTLELWQKENVKGLLEKADQNWVSLSRKE